MQDIVVGAENPRTGKKASAEKVLKYMEVACYTHVFWSSYPDM